MTIRSPDEELLELGRRLAENVARDKATPNDAPDEIWTQIDAEHWAIREKINDIPATTSEGVRVKVDAISLALAHDGCADECDGHGSVLTLAQSLCYDIKAQIAVNEREMAEMIRRASKAVKAA